MSGNWKTNTGTAMVEDLELLPRYKFWADVCGQCFGGLDIITVDVLVSAKDGKEYILEFNGTASGFGKDEEDDMILAEYTIEKMNEYFVEKTHNNEMPINIPEEMKIQPSDNNKEVSSQPNTITDTEKDIKNELQKTQENKNVNDAEDKHKEATQDNETNDKNIADKNE